MGINVDANTVAQQALWFGWSDDDLCGCFRGPGSAADC
jgi:hypothetical protein